MKRWPVIRHVRFFWLRYQVCRWAHECGQLGLGLGFPNQADLDHLDAIWKGDA